MAYHPQREKKKERMFEALQIHKISVSKLDLNILLMSTGK